LKTIVPDDFCHEACESDDADVEFPSDRVAGSMALSSVREDVKPVHVKRILQVGYISMFTEKSIVIVLAAHGYGDVCWACRTLNIGALTNMGCESDI
jgi:hypothetical protein